MLTAGCVLLAVISALVQLAPQRVERRVEYRWCHALDVAHLERRTVYVVDGKDGATSAEKVITVEGFVPANHGL